MERSELIQGKEGIRMKSRTKVIALAGILGITGIGGTFSYFSQDDTKTNVFNTGTYNTTLVEEFHPKDGENWKPGARIDKDVSVKNEGSLPVAVRVKFKERWFRTEDGKEQVLYAIDTTERLTLADSATASSENKFEHVYQGNAGDGLVGIDRDDSVVYKTLDPEGNWVYNPADGYYYYKYLLPGRTEDGDAAETTRILDEIRLSSEIDMGAYIEKRYYREGGGDWVEFATKSNAIAADARYDSTEELVKQGKKITSMKSMPVLLSEELKGYSQADYVLTIVAETVQATNGAIKSIFDIQDIEKLQAQLDLEWSGILDESLLYSADREATPSTAAPRTAAPSAGVPSGAEDTNRSAS